MWIFNSVSFYVLTFMLKYLEGNIFTNTYYTLIADALSTILGAYIYRTHGMNATYYVSYCISIIGSLTIFLF
jgi:hypothetical protein